MRLRTLNPIVGRGQRQLVLAVEVVEEASFGQTSRLADVLNPRGRISLNADHLDRSLQEFGFRFVSRFGYRHLRYQPVGMFCTIPTDWYADQGESLRHPEHPPTSRV